MKVLEVVKSAAKTMAAAVISPAAPARRVNRHAEEELRRRAEVNARGAAIRAQLAGGGGGWLGGRTGWLGRRRF